MPDGRHEQGNAKDQGTPSRPATGPGSLPFTPYGGTTAPYTPKAGATSKPVSLGCPHCKASGFTSTAEVAAHVKAQHPEAERAKAAGEKKG